MAKSEWLYYEDGIFYQKGEIAEIKLGDRLKRRFKVKKPFKLHGFVKDGGELVVTINVTLDALKGLGFIGKVKGGA